jgi:hypothetical protein
LYMVASVSFRIATLNNTLATIYNGIVRPTHMFLFISRYYNV